MLAESACLSSSDRVRNGCGSSTNEHGMTVETLAIEDLSMPVSRNGSKGSVGQTNYAAAKAGMHGFTKSLALEVARKGVTVNTVSPGYLATKMVTAIPQEILDTKILPQIPAVRLWR